MRTLNVYLGFNEP